MYFIIHSEIQFNNPIRYGHPIDKERHMIEKGYEHLQFLFFFIETDIYIKTNKLHLIILNIISFANLDASNMCEHLKRNKNIR